MEHDTPRQNRTGHVCNTRNDQKWPWLGSHRPGQKTEPFPAPGSPERVFQSPSLAPSHRGCRLAAPILQLQMQTEVQGLYSSTATWGPGPSNPRSWWLSKGTPVGLTALSGREMRPKWTHLCGFTHGWEGLAKGGAPDKKPQVWVEWEGQSHKGEGLFPEQMDRGQKDRGGGKCQGEEAKVHSHHQGRRRACLETHSQGDWDQIPCPWDWHFPQRMPNGPDSWKGEESTKIT